MDTIRVERDARGVATLWLARAEKHNALSAQMMTELEAAAGELARDATVRVVVLAAEGPTFCAGGDLNVLIERRKLSEPERREKILTQMTLLEAVLGPVTALSPDSTSRLTRKVTSGVDCRFGPQTLRNPFSTHSPKSQERRCTPDLTQTPT